MPTLIIDGDAKGGVEAYAQIIKAQKETADAMAKTTGAADKQERTMKRVFEESKAPAQKYQEQLAQINQFCDRHTKSEEERARMLAHVKQQYEQAGKAGEQSFGGAALAQVGAYVSGLASIGAVLGVIKGRMEAYRQERDKAMESSDDYTKSFAKLSEYGDHGLVSQGQFKGARLDAIAQQLQVKTGVSRQTAGELVSKAEASGVIDELHKEKMQKLVATGMIDAGSIDAIQQVRMSMGRDAKGAPNVSFEKALQTAFAAATIAPGQTKDVLAAMSPSMLLAHKSGYSLEQVAAFNAVSMKTMGVAEGGTASMNALNKLPETLKAFHLKTTGDPVADLQAVLGKKGGIDRLIVKGDKEDANLRAKKGMLAVTDNAGLYRDVLGRENAGQDFVSEIVQTQYENPLIATEIEKRKAAAALDTHLMEGRAPMGNIIEALTARDKAGTDTGFMGSLSRGVIDFGNATSTDASRLGYYLSANARGKAQGVFTPQLEAQALQAYGHSPDAMRSYDAASRVDIAKHYGLDKMVPQNTLNQFEVNGAAADPAGQAALTKAFDSLAQAIRENTAATHGNTSATAPKNRPLVPTLHRE